jgi:DNA-binding transcriptional ArsR family regulator
MGDLKPCPFCGSAAAIRSHGAGIEHVHCSNVFCALWALTGVAPAQWRVRAPVCTDPDTALGFLRRMILAALADAPEESWCRGLRSLSWATSLPREVIRGVLADLRENGLVEYRRGLMTDDGDVAGAGYALTARGRADAGAG